MIIPRSAASVVLPRPYSVGPTHAAGAGAGALTVSPAAAVAHLRVVRLFADADAAAEPGADAAEDVVAEAAKAAAATSSATSAACAVAGGESVGGEGERVGGEGGEGGEVGLLALVRGLYTQADAGGRWRCGSNSRLRQRTVSLRSASHHCLLILGPTPTAAARPLRPGARGSRSRLSWRS